MSYSTILFAIPRVPVAKFVSSLHNLPIHQTSVCKGVGWLKKPEAEQSLDWKACIVFLGQESTLPNSINSNISAFWNLTLMQNAISSQDAIWESAIPLTVRQSWEPGLGRFRVDIPSDWPSDLKELIKGQNRFDNPVMTIGLFQLPDSTSRSKFERLVKETAATLTSVPKVEIRAAGSISNSVGITAGLYTEALLLRYSSLEEYVLFVQSGWWDRLIQLNDLESVIENSALYLMQEFVLPDKGVPLAIYDKGWPFGHPYEAPGQDFFG